MPQDGQYWLEWQGRRVALRPGAAVTVGRAPESTIRLPEEDVHLSRRACEVLVYADHLEVVNVSERRDVRIRLPAGAGPDLVVRPRTSASTRGIPTFSLVFEGLDGTEYEVRGAGPSVLPTPRTSASDLVHTVGSAFHLSPTERRMLAALCRPLQQERGRAAVPATYNEIVAVTGSTYGYVRKVLDGVRSRLVAEGVPGFVRPAADAADYRLALAQHALRSGWRLDDGDPP